MHESQNHIIVNEAGAFIPKALFGQAEQIVDELRQAGVLPDSPPVQSNSTIKKVEMPDRSREMRWLKEYRQEYAGQWVALDGDRLVSHGLEAKEVFDAARAAGVDIPFLARVEPADQLPFGGW